MQIFFNTISCEWRLSCIIARTSSQSKMRTACVNNRWRASSGRRRNADKNWMTKKSNASQEKTCYDIPEIGVIRYRDGQTVFLVWNRVMKVSLPMSYRSR